MKRYILILLTILFSVVGFTQQVTISEEKVVIDGQKFYLHTVEKGQTLYGISKAYSVDIETIEKYNPGVIEGIKVGNSLKIPIVELSVDENIEEHRDEVNFIYHIVKRKETVYSLTKQYGITEEEFFEYNPEVKEKGLKTGNEIMIPRKQASTEYKYDFNEHVRDTTKYYYHKIKEGETLFSLSRDYEITRYELKKANPDLDWNKLKLGQEVAIPIENLNLISWPDSAKDSTELEFTDSIVTSNDSLKVLILFPFNIFANNKQLYNQSLYDKELAFLPLSEIMLDFYAGILIALDSLKNTDTVLSLRIEDIGTDTVLLSRLLEEDEIKENNVIIGPVFSDQISLVSREFGKNTLIINPFTECNLVELSYGKLYVTPPEQEYYRFVSEYCASSDSNQYLIISDRIDDRVETINNELVEAFEERDKETPSIKKLAFVEGEVKTLQNLMSESLNNVVIIPAHSEPYVARIMSKLSQVEDVRIQLIGYENWTNYGSIQSGYFSKLNFTYASQYNIDYSNPKIRDFVLNYREVFQTEPTKYGFLAYDIIISLSKLYSLNISIINGESPEYLSINGLASSYEFYPYVPGGAIVNTRLYLYSLRENFSLNLVYPISDINNSVE